ncbi:MAG: hypothetical protein E6G31_04730 [Actinobacteria bacterium]|nr:MAG: hypothetical protein E6G31_04730 [Actinomycetota bacterium]
MIWALMRWVGFAAVAVVALVVAHMLAPGRKELELDVFVLVLGGLGLMVLASELRRLAPPAEGSLVDLHYRLRPILRDIASARLDQRGLDIDSGRPQVEELLGDELYELTTAEREPPANRLAPGPGVDGLDRTIGRLERL